MNDYIKMLIEALRSKQVNDPMQQQPQPGMQPVPMPQAPPSQVPMAPMPVIGGQNPANRRALEEAGM